MASAAHFISKRAGIDREGLLPLGEERYRSCCWATSDMDAQSLIGGWIHLHETKNEPSAIGSIVDGRAPGDGTQERLCDYFSRSYRGS